jgi:alginate O-acetyltransferase complex protein AlgI
MLFNSFSFLLFFLVVTPLYYLTPFKLRWLLLLLASCYFYASFIPAYLLVLFAIIIIDYFAGRLIESASVENPAARASVGGLTSPASSIAPSSQASTFRRKKFFLILSLAANLGVLAVFKYYNFFVANTNDLLALLHIHTRSFPLWTLALPIGLSFHTFQAMSYTIEVYKGNSAAEKHFGIYALYVMFYPQLVAGPIERPGKLLPQFRERHLPDYSGIAAGLKQMAWGLFMKVVVADRLAIFVNYVYSHPGSHGRLALLTASFFYSFQIYCDFAGYSLIAIGAARTMGFTLSENFRRPYFSASLRNFWSRWHITLSSWFRDYLYIPLGGSHTGALRYACNIAVVFLLSGLWHGANWTFVIWGLLHGLIILIESFSSRLRRSRLRRSAFSRPVLAASNPHPPSRLPGILYSFSLVTLLWIFFRSPDLHGAMVFLNRIFSPHTPWQIAGEFEERSLMLYSLFGIGCILAADMQKEFLSGKTLLLDHKKPGVRLAACIGLVLMIVLLGVFNGSQFIYFQF